MASEPGITLQRITKSYGSADETTTVFDQVSLTIKAGMMTAIMGPSGSGKSTLLNMLSGMDRPDSGEINVLGTNVAALNPQQAAVWRRANIGYVFQDASLIGALTAGENIQLPMLFGVMRRDERQRLATGLLITVGLAGLDKRRPASLSRGQAQRVGLARALAAKPRLLLCDEPTGNLDRANADALMRILRTIVDDFGVTVIMATHDADTSAFADDIINIERCDHLTFQRGGYVLS